MIDPLVRELAADRIAVAVTCRVLKKAHQPYYRWLANPATDGELAEAYLANAIFDAHRDDPEFGYRFLTDEAKAAGHRAAERTVWRICRDNRFTEHPTGEGKLYLCAIKVVYSNRIVGYSIDSGMKSRLAVAALETAVARRGDVAGCVLHLGRGSQSRSRKFVRALHRHGLVGSMAQVGASLLTGYSRRLAWSATRRCSVTCLPHRVMAGTCVLHEQRGGSAA